MCRSKIPLNAAIVSAYTTTLWAECGSEPQRALSRQVGCCSLPLAEPPSSLGPSWRDACAENHLPVSTLHHRSSTSCTSHPGWSPAAALLWPWPGPAGKGSFTSGWSLTLRLVSCFWIQQLPRYLTVKHLSDVGILTPLCPLHFCTQQGFQVLFNSLHSFTHFQRGFLQCCTELQ